MRTRYLVLGRMQHQVFQKAFTKLTDVVQVTLCRVLQV